MSSDPSTLDDSQSGATTGQKRTHDPEPVTACGCSKQQKQDALTTEARHIGRSMDAFLIPGMMFNFGLGNLVSENAKLDDLDLEEITDEQTRWFKIYKHLCSRMPHFEARIIDVDAKTFRKHEKLFIAGLSAARSEDISSLKVVVVDWISGPPYNASTSSYPLARNTKTTRGFNNPVIGELLCPMDLKWSDSA